MHIQLNICAKKCAFLRQLSTFKDFRYEFIYPIVDWIFAFLFFVKVIFLPFGFLKSAGKSLVISSICSAVMPSEHPAKTYGSESVKVLGFQPSYRFLNAQSGLNSKIFFQ